MRLWVPLAIVGCLASSVARAEMVQSFSDMPQDSVLLFPPTYPGFWDFKNSTLPSYGIQYYRYPQGYAYASGQGYFPSNTGSSISPYRVVDYEFPVRFVFEEPVFAFGGTFFATQYPERDNTSDAFDNNVGNTATTVTAYGISGNIIEETQASAYGSINGPVEYHTTFRGTEFMTSWAGVWSDQPIYEVTFSGPDPLSSTGTDAIWGCIAFSRTPYVVPVPEPNPVPLPGAVLLGLVGLGYAGVRLRRIRGSGETI